MSKEVKNMPDYQAMYTKLLMATEAAINILIDAQRECEEIYISSPEPELRFLPQVVPSEHDAKEKTDG